LDRCVGTPQHTGKERGLQAHFPGANPSTYPLNIACKAVQMQDRALAKKFLRRIREASDAETSQTNTTEVLPELASEEGLDIARFLSSRKQER
jgi:putative protein-disulfide isomerase